SITKDYQIDYNLPLTFLNSVDSGKENIFASLQEFAKSELSVSNVSLFEFKSSLWYLTQSIYQEWYLGSTLFETVEG
ncbi:HAD family hydrolase, partial [Staphylococcus warneri]